MRSPEIRGDQSERYFRPIPRLNTALVIVSLLFSTMAQAANRGLLPAPPASPLLLAENTPGAPEKPATKQKSANPTPTTPHKGSAAAQPSGKSWQQDLRRDIEACRQLGFFKRAFCMDRARFKYCFPDRWNLAPECGSPNPPPGSPP
jgi:hypothetical protein